jgi:hypothetical protein
MLITCTKKKARALNQMEGKKNVAGMTLSMKEQAKEALVRRIGETKDEDKLCTCFKYSVHRKYNVFIFIIANMLTSGNPNFVPIRFNSSS